MKVINGSIIKVWTLMEFSSKKKPGSVRHKARTIRENRSALKVSPCKFLTVCSLNFKLSLSHLNLPPPVRPSLPQQKEQSGNYKAMR